MMVINPIDQGAYDQMATRTTYLKIVPYLIQDFVHRYDALQMMLPSNLPVNATVTTVVNVTGAAGAMAGAGIGPLSTTAVPSYNASAPAAATKAFEQQCAAEKLTGQGATKGLTSALESTGV